MQKIKTALLSYGMSGRVFHAPFITVTEGLELSGSWERSKKVIEEKYPSVHSYTSLDEILNDNSIGLVIVNTPTNTHFEYASKALLAGKHVVVEKAFTTTVEEAETLKKIADQQRLKIAVYQNRRWDSDFRTVKKVIESHILGTINEMEIHFDRYKIELSPKLHKESPNKGSGLLKDLGPHIIDQALCLFGMPLQLFADIRITRPGSLVDDYFDILLYYPQHRVSLKAGYIIKEALPAYIVHGTKGSFIKSRADVQETNLQKGMLPVTADWGTEPENEAGIIHYEKDGISIRENIHTLKGDYREFYTGVYKALTEDCPMPVTVDDGIQVMKIIEAALKSSKEQHVLTF